MTVKVKIHQYILRSGEGAWVTTETDGKTLRECLEQASARFPKLKKELSDPTGKLPGHVLVLLNGEEVQSDGLNQQVKDGDTIEILPIIGGG
jgi:MoaD family protein